MGSASKGNEKMSALRFADFGPLPKRMLGPIEGFENCLVVTLEEAVKPLVSIVPKVERNVYFAKKNCKHPEDGLTSDESAAIMLYTLESIPHKDSLYVILNATLRSEQRQELVPWFLYLRLVLTGLARLPSISCNVFRGIKEKLWPDYPDNRTFIWWGFSSCTSTIKVLENQLFFGTSGERTLFQIECFSAKDIKNHSFVRGENEVLLLPGREFKVKSSLNSGNGLHIIQLVEQKQQYDLLAPVSIPAPVPGPVPVRAPSPSSKRFIPDLPVNARWEQQGVTVAGGNGKGENKNQFNDPCGLFVDDDGDQTIVIADHGNHRIMQWRVGDTQGQVVAGGNGRGNRLDQLDRPTDVLIDKERNSLIITDYNNRRVVRWSRRSGTTQSDILIDNVNCWGLAMNEQRNLYVSDIDKHEVRRYEIDRGDKKGTVVADGNGKGSGQNQLLFPYYYFVNRNQSLYVSDSGNHRVMKWDAGAAQGVVVAGGQGNGSALTQLYSPNGIFVDTLGTLYVAEWGNHRVTRWPQGSEKKRTVVLGGNGEGSGANQFSGALMACLSVNIEISMLSIVTIILYKDSTS